MARTTVSITTMLGAYGDYSTPNAADITFQAADVANDNQALLNEGDILLVWNKGASPYTFTVTSVALYGRTGDVSAYSVGAGEIAAFGPYKHAGWKQSDGYCYFDASSTNIYFAIIRSL